jgi:ceramide glucosyltransferase
LKPLRGAEALAEECLASFCRQEYPEFEVIFGVEDPADPNVEIVARLRRDYPEVPIRLVLSDRRIGANPKVAKLANMLAEARHDLLVISDSDMRVGPDYLQQVAAAFLNPDVGLLTCPYRAVNANSASAAVEALDISTNFFPGVLLVARLGRPDFAFGSTMAVRREVLNRAGGLAAIADYWADDFQLGHRIAKRGLRVIVSSYMVETILPNDGWRAMLARRLRANQIVRVCRPGGHAGSLITQSEIFALAFLAASEFQEIGWVVLSVQQAVRWTTAWQVAIRDLGNRELARWFWLLPFADLIAFSLFIVSWTGRAIVWRGEHFRLLPGGRLQPMSSPKKEIR